MRKNRLGVFVALAGAVLAMTGPAALAAEPDRQAVIDRALQLIQGHPSTFDLAPPPAALAARAGPVPNAPAAGTSAWPAVRDEFKPRDVIVDKDGTEHVRFDRLYAGLRVVGGDLVVHSSKAGQLIQPEVAQRSAVQSPQTLGSVDGRTVIQNAPDIGADRAKHIAAERFASAVTRYGTPDLVVFARNAAPVLAYEVRLYGRATPRHGTAVVYYVDGRDGTLLDAEDLVHTASAATGIGRSLYYGELRIATDQTGSNAYRMVDPSRGSGQVIDGRDAVDTDLPGATDLVPFTSPDNLWGNGALTDRKTVAVDIDYGLAKTWDYYRQMHGRTGIFNDGRGVQSYAHVLFNDGYGNLTGANAAWLGESRQMAYDGQAGTALAWPVVSIDVAGHEMSHGVNQATANLAYSRDAGGLNEASSDIFGTLVKFYANNANDPGNYVIGARILSGGLRKMYKQDLDGRSYACYAQGGFTTTLVNARHNPHFTSGVGNRFFHLLAEGAVVPATDTGLTRNELVCNGDTGLAGIGRDKAGQIWYRTLALYLGSGSTYPQARAASIRAASDLYGSNSFETAAVRRAWSAVLVD